MPPPKDFEGHRNRSDGFIAECSMLFLFYPEQFALDVRKIRYVLLLCKGSASTWRDTEMKKVMNGTQGTWAQFKERFEHQWKEVNSTLSALNKIKMLKLGKWGINGLLSRFEELVPYCGLEDNHMMKIELFAGCLPENIQRHVFLQDPQTYEEARKAAVQYGLMNDRIDVQKGKKPQYGIVGYQRATTAKDPYAMDVDAIDLDQNEEANIRFTKLSPDQINDYRRQGKCFNCGTQGHMSRHCPKKKNNGNKGKQPQRGNGSWRKGNSSKSVRSMETDDEPAEEDRGEGSSGGDQVARIRAMIAQLDEDERAEFLGKDF